ncbi:MAG: hypothetical protein AABY53_00325, partial [Bdellovibrionota bacterium]
LGETATLLSPERCLLYGFPALANVIISKIIAEGVPAQKDLSIGPISVPGAKLHPSDFKPIIPVNTPTLINVPVSISYNPSTPLTPAELSTFVPVTLQAGSQTLTQSVSIANLVANGGSMTLPFNVTFQPIDVGLKTLIATVNAGQQFTESNFVNNSTQLEVHVGGNYKIKKTISIIKGSTLTPVGNPDLFQMIPTTDTRSTHCKKTNAPSKIRIKVECQNDDEVSDNIEGCKIQMQKELGAFLGGHFSLPHFGSPRPLGLFSPLAAEAQLNDIPLNGLTFEYEAPEPAGEIDLKFIAKGPDSATFEVPKSRVQVKIDGLVSLAGVPYLTMIDTGHLTQDESEEGGVYTSLNYKTKIQAALGDYFKKCLKAGIPENQIVLLTSEAASLVWGGLYDINFDWFPSHCGHRIGNAIDIGMKNFNLSSSLHVAKMKEILEGSLRKNGMIFPIPSESPTGNKHWHTQLN